MISSSFQSFIYVSSSSTGCIPLSFRYFRVYSVERMQFSLDPAWNTHSKEIGKQLGCSNSGKFVWKPLKDYMFPFSWRVLFVVHSGFIDLTKCLHKIQIMIFNASIFLIFFFNLSLMSTKNLFNIYKTGKKWSINCLFRMSYKCTYFDLTLIFLA